MDKTFKIQKKYNRNAIVYDLIEFPVEKVLYSFVLLFPYLPNG
ncbi:unnamed protein product [marine sediment metagenome]|uniref:Uncharacterized protein n=1 Tax=marine sediment metagenome TaxID=412755 RepID=X1GQD4_9ZZZZ